MINNKRIRNVNIYLLGIGDGEEFYVAKSASGILHNRIESIGFSNGLSNGDQVLPRCGGPISRFNAQGGFNRLMDLPMETMYRSICMQDWHGNDHYVDIPYERYQREEIVAPSVELKVVDIEGELYIVSPKLRKADSEENNNKHVINLFLELFGSCEIFNQSYKPSISTIPTKRVNWQILPEGEYPWRRLSQMAGNLSSHRIGKAKMQERNITTILNYKPSQLIYGVGGFRGYLVFRFPEENLFVMENVMYGNATYIFENDWEQFSQLTKADIIQNKLQKHRLEHRSGWESEIRRILS